MCVCCEDQDEALADVGTACCAPQGRQMDLCHWRDRGRGSSQGACTCSVLCRSACSFGPCICLRPRVSVAIVVMKSTKRRKVVGKTCTGSEVALQHAMSFDSPIGRLWLQRIIRRAPRILMSRTGTRTHALAQPDVCIQFPSDFLRSFEGLSLVLVQVLCRNANPDAFTDEES